MGEKMRSVHLRRPLRVAASIVLGVAAIAAGGPGFAAENSTVGAGNALAVNTSDRSALVLSAKNYILVRAGEIGDEKLRGATLDAIDNPKTCIRHRIGLDGAAKTRIMTSSRPKVWSTPRMRPSFPAG
jgi:hypothetical protein